MRIVISEFLTLDGVMQAPGGSEEDRSEGFEHGGWQLDNGYVDDVGGQVVTEAFENSDGMPLGRRTYDIFAGYSPTSTEEPTAGQMNAMKKYVAYTPLKESFEWHNSTLLHGDVVGAAQKLREEPRRDLQVIGSGKFAQTLMNKGMVDEYRLMIHPIVLGSGRRLFNDLESDVHGQLPLDVAAILDNSGAKPTGGPASSGRCRRSRCPVGARRSPTTACLCTRLRATRRRARRTDRASRTSSRFRFETWATPEGGPSPSGSLSPRALCYTTRSRSSSRVPGWSVSCVGAGRPSWGFRPHYW